jgi:hypothetical protein
LPRARCSRRGKGIEIQPEARRIGATPNRQRLIAVLQTQIRSESFEPLLADVASDHPIHPLSPPCLAGLR